MLDHENEEMSLRDLGGSERRDRGRTGDILDEWVSEALAVVTAMGSREEETRVGFGPAKRHGLGVAEVTGGLETI